MDMLEDNRQRTTEMVSFTNRRNGRCARWCAFVVLMAVCSLAISVTTRYSSAEAAPCSPVKASSSSFTQEHARQRLTKDAADWTPPVIVSSTLQEPASYAVVVPEKPAIANSSLGSVIYYRPPPSADFLS
jgi:hypothetical protein